MSFGLSPSANVLDKLCKIHLFSIHQSAHEIKCPYSHSSHALTSASLWTSIDQNQGKDLFHCPRTLGAIMAISILKSWRSRTLYRSRREVSAPRSSIACRT